MAVFAFSTRVSIAIVSTTMTFSITLIYKKSVAPTNTCLPFKNFSRLLLGQTYCHQVEISRRGSVDFFPLRSFFQTIKVEQIRWLVFPLCTKTESWKVSCFRALQHIHFFEPKKIDFPSPLIMLACVRGTKNNLL